MKRFTSGSDGKTYIASILESVSQLVKKYKVVARGW